MLNYYHTLHSKICLILFNLWFKMKSMLSFSLKNHCKLKLIGSVNVVSIRCPFWRPGSQRGMLRTT